MWGDGGGGVGDGEVESIQENGTRVCIDMNDMFEREENIGGLKDEYNKEGLKIKYRSLKGIFKVFVFG